MKEQIEDTRSELHELIEIREALSEVILKVSQRLDVLIVEYTKKAEQEKEA